jgi:cytochrome c553
MAVDFSRFENRDSRTPFVAYVPRGSISLGQDLVMTGAHGRSLSCISCHGPDLKGLIDIPRLAGRSPSYLVRQLYDMRCGTRKGGNAELMKPVVAKLNDGDIVALAAFLASLPP